MRKTSDIYHKTRKVLKNVAFHRVVFQRVYTPIGCLIVITITLFLISNVRLFLSIELTMLIDKGVGQWQTFVI